MRNYYKIAHFLFAIECEEELNIPSMFRKFAVPGGEPEYTYRVYVPEEQIDEAFGPWLESSETDRVLTRRNGILVASTEAGEKRLVGIPGTGSYYGCYREVSDSAAEIWIHRETVSDLVIDTIFVSLFMLERRMHDRQGYILHCAYMEHGDRAILFSAPSGTGKSTQAGLWEKYRGTRQINGDRCLLTMEDGRLYANGWPVCGSSGICEPESRPVEAIVMLSQGKTNEIRRIGGREAFTQLYSQITINAWNMAYVNDAMDFIESILGGVPMYHLSCTISEEAVEVLEQELKRGNV